MHRTVAVVAALCVLSSGVIAPIATNVPSAPGAAASMGAGLTAGSVLAVVPAPSLVPAEGGGDRSRAIGSGNGVLATPGNNTTAYLTIAPENVTNTTTTRATLDVGGALAVDAAATSEAVNALTLDERLSRANTTAAKQVVIRQAGTRIERRIDRQLANQRATIEAYSESEISTREFVYTLARTQRRAEGLRRAVDRLESAAASVPGTAIGGETVDSWARDRRVELGLVTSPLRERIVGALGGTGPIELFVEVSDTGVVLAATDRGQYLRDTYLPAERDDRPPDGPDSTSGALGLTSERYPWAWNHSTGFESAGGPAAGSYRITIFHQQGRLTTHLDPRTGTVFREIQVKRLGAVPTASAVTATGDGMRVQVRRTDATGPMNVSVVDARTGAPINATVLVDNRTVGPTGSGGYRWTITPRGQVNVTVTDDDRVVTARFASNPRSPGTDEGRPPGESGLVTPRANESTGVENTTGVNTSADVTGASRTTASPGNRSTPAPDPDTPGGR